MPCGLFQHGRPAATVANVVEDAECLAEVAGGGPVVPGIPPNDPRMQCALPRLLVAQVPVDLQRLAQVTDGSSVLPGPLRAPVNEAAS